MRLPINGGLFLRLPRLVAIESMNQMHDGRGICDPKRSARRYLCRYGAERYQKTQTAQQWTKQIHKRSDPLENHPHRIIPRLGDGEGKEKYMKSGVGKEFLKALQLKDPSD